MLRSLFRAFTRIRFLACLVFAKLFTPPYPFFPICSMIIARLIFQINTRKAFHANISPAGREMGRAMETYHQGIAK
jgi:hypothetical protein